MPITLTDSEQRFADSPRGRNAVAHAKMRHDTQQAWRGRDAAPWTEALEAAVVRSLAVADARSRVVGAAMADGLAADTAAARAAADTARAVMVENMRNAWRNGR